MIRAGKIFTIFFTLMIVLLQLLWPCSAFSDMQIDFKQFHQLMAQRFGASRLEVSQAWEKLLLEAARLPEQARIDKIHRFFQHHLQYETDLQIWGQKDYWATPLETLGTGRGDCEDWAIAKYFSLRLVGIAEPHLRLIYVRHENSTTSEPHVVLGCHVAAAAELLILDSRFPRVFPLSRRSDLKPLFSFNSENLWIGIQSEPAIGTFASLSLWYDLLNRVQQEGISW